MNQAVPNSTYSPNCQNFDLYEVPSPIHSNNSSPPAHSQLSPHQVPSPNCQVPSPSQWLDPCRSPPSLHSPSHLPADLEKIKEEPYSPAPQYITLSPPGLTPLNPSNVTSMSSPMSNMSSLSVPSPPRMDFSPQPIKKEGYEPSINLGELLAENTNLISSHGTQQVQYRDEMQHQNIHHNNHLQMQQNLHERENQDLKPSLLNQHTRHEQFLDSLVDIKQEVEDEQTQQRGTSRNEVLEVVGLLALEHARRDATSIAQFLQIPIGE